MKEVDVENAVAMTARHVRQNPEALAAAMEAALLNVKPLRDLAQNWDIDIASCLNDYLNELAQLGRAPDPRLAEIPGLRRPTDGGGSCSPPNFAQAALLLQNSSCVYGRKVEYLHSLVYAALNDLLASAANQNSKGDKQKRTRTAGDGILDELHAADPDCLFLPLDDVLPTDESEGNGRINLIEEEENRALDDTLIGDFLGQNLSSRVSGGANDLSLGGLDVTRLDRPSLSGGFVRGGINQAALARSLMGLLAEGSDANGGNLRLLSGKCDVGRDGALLMPGSSLINGDAYRRRSNGLRVPRGDTVSGLQLVYVAEQSHENMSGINAEPVDFGSGNAYDDGIDDHDGDGDAGFDLVPDPEGAFEGEEKKEDSAADVIVAHPQNSGLSNAVQTAPTPPTPPEKPDPWHLLDPHDLTTLRACPLRIGVTLRLPPGVDDRPSAYVNGTRTKRSEALRERLERSRVEKRDKRRSAMIGTGRCIVAEAFVAAMARARNREAMKKSADKKKEGSKDEKENESNTVGKDLHEASASFLSGGKNDSVIEDKAEAAWTVISTKGLVFGEEFAYIAKATAKRRAAERREERKKKIANEALSLANAGSSANNAATAIAAATSAMEQDDYEDGDDYGDVFGFAAGGDDDSIDDEHNGMKSNAAIGSLEEAFAGAVGTLGSTDDDEANRPQTFEELCRAHVEAFARGADRYAAETNLTKRVGDWQSRLLPILEEEENRPEFDIHLYGKRILSRVKDALQRRSSSINEKLTEGGDVLDEFDDQKESGQDESRDWGGEDQTVGFVEVASGSERYEVCRLFLSSLMLCNSGNIVLGQTDREPDGEARVATTDTLGVTLMDGVLNHPIENYLAPSVQEQEEKERDGLFT